MRIEIIQRQVDNMTSNQLWTHGRDLAAQCHEELVDGNIPSLIGDDLTDLQYDRLRSGFNSYIVEWLWFVPCRFELFI